MGRRGTDPYAGRRAEDASGYWVAAFFGRLTWPLALFSAVLLLVVSAVYFKYGEATALRYLAFLRGPLAAAVGSLLVVCVGAVLSKIPQWARMDRRTGAIQKQLTDYQSVSSERVDNLAVFMREVSTKVDRLDERLDDLGDGVVARRLEDAVRRFETLAQRTPPSAPVPVGELEPEPAPIVAVSAHATPAALAHEPAERPENPWGPSGPVSLTHTGSVVLRPYAGAPAPADPGPDPLDVSQPWPGYDLGAPAGEDTLSGKLAYPGAPEVHWPNVWDEQARRARQRAVEPEEGA